METKKEKTGSEDLKEKKDSPSRRSLWEILQQGPGSSCAPLSGLAATSEPAAKISAKGMNEPVVRNLREVKPGRKKKPLLGVRSTVIFPFKTKRGCLIVMSRSFSHHVKSWWWSCSELSSLRGSAPCLEWYQVIVHHSVHIFSMAHMSVHVLHSLN
jgi:hypothetical protein